MNAPPQAVTVSDAELVQNFAEVLASAQDRPIAVLHNNEPQAYLLSAEKYASLLECLEDAEDRIVVAERRNGPFVEVSLDAL